MFCKNCGSQNTDTAFFCSACGASLQENINVKKKKHTGVVVSTVVVAIVVICAVLTAVFVMKLPSKENPAHSAVAIQTPKYVTISDLENALFEALRQEDLSVLDPYFVPNIKQALSSSELEEIGGFITNAYFERIKNTPREFDPKTVQYVVAESIDYTNMEKYKEILEKEGYELDEEEIEFVIFNKCNQCCLSAGLENLNNLCRIEFEVVADYSTKDYFPECWVMATETNYGWRIVAVA